MSGKKEKKPTLVFVNDDLKKAEEKCKKAGGELGSRCFRQGVEVGMGVIKEALVEGGHDEGEIQSIIDGTMEEKKSTRKAQSSKMFWKDPEAKKQWEAHKGKCKGCGKCVSKKSEKGSPNWGTYVSGLWKDIEAKAKKGDANAKKIVARVNKATEEHNAEIGDTTEVTEEEVVEEVVEVKKPVAKKPAAPAKKPAVPAKPGVKKPTVRKQIK